jgi:hypothetical protein
MSSKTLILQVKVKVTLEQAMKAQRGSRGISGQRHAPAALPPGMNRYPLYRRLSRPQGWSGLVLKTSTPPGFHPRTVQLVASRYTDYAIPAHTLILKYVKTGHLVKKFKW